MPIFISYSHADSDFVDRLAGQLVLRAVNVWVDRWELNVGDSLIDRVEDAIAGATALLVVLSKASVESNWVKKEVNAGLVRELDEKQVIVLPVLAEDCQVPVFLREKVLADFRTNFDDGLHKILESVAKVTNANSARTEAPTFHTDWGLDWGEFDDLVFLRLKFVEQVKDQPYTVLCTVQIVLNEVATVEYQRDVRTAGEDAVHREIISDVANEVGDLTFLLKDQFEQERCVEILSGSRRYSIAISAQRLGEDTGRDVLYRAGRQIENALMHMTNVAVKRRNR